MSAIGVRFMFHRQICARVAAAASMGLMCHPYAWGAPKEIPRADRVVIVKSQRTLTLLRQGKVLKIYKVALGGEPRGPKTRQGDNKTPEGLYTIDSRNPHSQFHLALHISYPNAADRVRAKERGVDPGGAIMIHGLPRGFAALGPLHRQTDWTEGCVAVTNAEIEEIWSLVPLGTTVEIKP
jgi:murein L,D-transpeptidase YafK